MPPQYFGLLFGANALSLIVCSQISARLLRTHPPRLLQRRALTALACASLAAVALTVAGWMSLPLLMLCLIGYMGSQGFVNPNSAALALAEQAPGRRLGLAGDGSTVLRRAGRIRRQRLADRQRPAPDDHAGDLRLPVLDLWPRGAIAHSIALSLDLLGFSY